MWLAHNQLYYLLLNVTLFQIPYSYSIAETKNSLLKIPWIKKKKKFLELEKFCPPCSFNKCQILPILRSPLETGILQLELMQFFIPYLIREQGQDKVLPEKKKRKKESKQLIHVNKLEPNFYFSVFT